METVEIIIYLAIALIVGSLVIGFLTNWDVKPIYNFLSGKKEEGFQRLDAVEFANYAYNCWSSCGFGETQKECGVILIQGNGTLSKSSLFETYKKLNWCESIQCASCGCGTREDVNMQSLSLPHVIKVKCASNKLQIEG